MRKVLAVLFLIFLQQSICFAQFVKSDISIYPSNFASTDWGDYDNDGDLDILMWTTLYSNLETVVIKNNPDSTFSVSEIVLPRSYRHSYPRWVDIDADGLLDIWMFGNDVTYKGFHFIYRNLGNDQFEKILLPNFNGTFAKADFGDYDQDGDVDILLYRKSFDYVFPLMILTQEEGLEFRAEEFPIYYYSSWGDCDNDGDLDLLVSSNTTSIYKYDKGKYTLTSFPLPSFVVSSSSWLDYNQDGFLDIFISGYIDGKNTKLIYKNAKGASFEKANVEFPNIQFSAIDPVDFDNDGDTDIIANGLVLLSFDGNKTYQVAMSLEPLSSSETDFIDFDDDGDLDILQHGNKNEVPFSYS